MSTLQPFLQVNLEKPNFHPLLRPLVSSDRSSFHLSSKSALPRLTIRACLSSNSQPGGGGGVCPMANQFAFSATNQHVLNTNEKDNESSPVQLPPGPWKLPFIGNMLQLIGHLPRRRLRDLATIYGPVMSVHLGEVYAVVISSADAAKEILRNQNGNFVDRPPLQVSEIVLYSNQDIVFGSYGDQWRQMRRLCTTELLSIKRVQSFKSVREEEVSNFIKHLFSKAGTPVNVTEGLYTLTNSIMLRASIGKKCRDQDTLLRVIEGIVGAGDGFSVADVFPSAVFLHDIFGDKSHYENLRRDADLILDEILNEHRGNRGNDQNQGEAENLLDVLLDLQENGNLEVPLSDECIKAVILDMFGAGSDTASKSTEWALSELIRQPEAMKKAQDEVRKVFGEMGYVEDAQLHHLKYLKLVIKETLRLHPPIPLIPRECRARIKVNGFDILPKTKALVNIWAIARDPTIWPEADKFIPERFENSLMDFKGNHCEYTPFGSGKRICPGMALGTANVELYLAHMLYHFDWKLADGKSPETLDMSEVVGGAIKRRVDLNLIPVPIHPLLPEK